MRARDSAASTSRLTRLVVTFAAVAAAGCASVRGPEPPKGWVRSAELELREPLGYGTWAAFYFREHPRRIEGELIAIDRDSVVVFSTEGIRVRRAWELVKVAVLVPAESGLTTLDWIAAKDYPRIAGLARFPGGVPAGIDVRGLLPKRGLRPESPASE